MNNVPPTYVRILLDLQMHNGHLLANGTLSKDNFPGYCQYFNWPCYHHWPAAFNYHPPSPPTPPTPIPAPLPPPPASLVPHICGSEWCQHCLRKLLIACSAPSHYLNQCWVLVNWKLRNKLQWNFNQIYFFAHKIASESIIYEMAAILSRGTWVNTSDCQVHEHHTRTTCRELGYRIIIYAYKWNDINF